MDVSLNGLDALLSTVQMPGGIPVASVAIGKAGAKNAAYLAAQIIATADSDLAARVRADRQANATPGRGHALEPLGNVVVSTGPVVSVVGVEDLVVVATPDAVLVIPKDQSQRVKEVVEALRTKGWDDVL